MTKGSRIALAIAGAAAIGAIIGLLTAPESGNEIRKRVKKTTGKWVDSMGRIFTRHKNDLEIAARKVQPAISEYEM